MVPPPSSLRQVSLAAVASIPLLLGIPTTLLSQIAESPPAEPGRFSGRLEPWRSLQGAHIVGLSVSGVAAISGPGERPQISLALGAMTFCDPAQALTVEIQSVWLGPNGQIATRTAPASLQVGRERIHIPEVSVVVGGRALDLPGSFVWLEDTGRPSGIVRIRGQAALPAGTAGGLQRQDVVFQAGFNAVPWLQRIEEVIGNEAFSRLAPVPRMEAVQAAACGTPLPAAPAPPPPPPPAAPGSVSDAEGNFERWEAACMAEWTEASGPRAAYARRCQCTARVLANTARYLQPQEFEYLPKSFWPTVEAVLRRGRRPAVYVVQAACDG